MGIFSGGASTPYVPPLPAAPPAAPKPVDAGTLQAAKNTKSALASAGGYSSTILTSAQGVSGNTPVAGKTLLGA